MRAAWVLGALLLMPGSVREAGAAPGDLLWQRVDDRAGGLDAAVAAAADDGRVYAGGYASTAAGGLSFSVVAYDALSGAVAWRSHYDREGALEDRVGANALAVDGGRVFAGGVTQTDAGGTVFAVRAYRAVDGRPLWQYTFDRPERQADEVHGLVARGGRVFACGRVSTAAGSAFTVRAFDAATGALLWARDTQRSTVGDAARAIAADDARVYATGEVTVDGASYFTVQALWQDDGAPAWESLFSRPSLRGGIGLAVAVEAGRVFAAGTTGSRTGGAAFSVLAFDAATGQRLWKQQYDRNGLRTDQACAIAVDGERVFAAGATSTPGGGFAFSVRAYRAFDGALLWQRHLDREGTLQDQARAVAAGGGRVFVAGFTSTAAHGAAFTVRAHDGASGRLVWERRHERWPGEAFALALLGETVVAAGVTQAGARGGDFTVRACRGW